MNDSYHEFFVIPAGKELIPIYGFDGAFINIPLWVKYNHPAFQIEETIFIDQNGDLYEIEISEFDWASIRKLESPRIRFFHKSNQTALAPVI